MRNKSNLDRIPKPVLNECCFCHQRGLKPGVLAVRYREDLGAQKYFSSRADEMKLTDHGMCARCADLIGVSDR